MLLCGIKGIFICIIRQTPFPSFSRGEKKGLPKDRELKQNSSSFQTSSIFRLQNILQTPCMKTVEVPFHSPKSSSHISFLSVMLRLSLPVLSHSCISHIHTQLAPTTAQLSLLQLLHTHLPNSLCTILHYVYHTLPQNVKFTVLFKAKISHTFLKENSKFKVFE